jgi:hypothetical protein
MAKKLLAEAGYPNGIDLTMNVVNTTMTLTNATQQVANDLTAAGIRTKLSKGSSIPPQRFGCTNLNKPLAFKSSIVSGNIRRACSVALARSRKTGTSPSASLRASCMLQDEKSRSPWDDNLTFSVSGPSASARGASITAGPARCPSINAAPA